MYTLEEMKEMLSNWESQLEQQGNYADSRLIQKIFNMKKAIAGVEHEQSKS
jgi:uncharacterized protein YjgD (DUF1641 family)